MSRRKREEEKEYREVRRGAWKEERVEEAGQGGSKEWVSRRENERGGMASQS